ncbi:putative secreted protein [Anopheles sinensis]|uniref:Putative secreted protein n=1 Tax=Anopheles sinensis TaxID=74873 RepID=A0A084VMU3_ANOSI|nr:putative secreted protein [Anopheles sinensis]
MRQQFFPFHQSSVRPVCFLVGGARITRSIMFPPEEGITMVSQEKTRLDIGRFKTKRRNTIIRVGGGSSHPDMMFIECPTIWRYGTRSCHTCAEEESLN